MNKHSLLFLLVACGTSEHGLDLDPMDRLTVTRGVYGFAISGCDTESCTASVVSGVGMGALDGEPTSPEPLIARVVTTTDTDGFFEIALIAGPVTLARGEGPANAFEPLAPFHAAEVATGVPLRVDFVFGPDGGRFVAGGVDAD